MTVALSPIGNSGTPFFTSQGVILSGGKINTYVAGSTTPTATFTDNTGGTPNANPIILNSAGLPPNAIWLTSGQNYKFVITDSANNVLQTFDNISGMASSISATSEWLVTGIAPTYVSATSFTTAGNTTATFQVGRRIQATVTAGTVYGYVISSSFAANTTVNVILDAGSLDSGLSQVNVGLISVTTGSLPAVVSSAQEGIGNTGFNAWGSQYRVLNLGTHGAAIIGQTATDQCVLVNNGYFDGAAWRYVTTGALSILELVGGTANFYVAASGTAGTVATINKAWTATNPGQVTTPLQPAFEAHRATSAQTTGTTMIFNTKDKDIATNYDNTTGIFTAPVDGWYLLTASCGFSNTSGGTIINEMEFNVQGQLWASQTVSCPTATTTTASIAQLVFMSATNTAFVRSSTTLSATFSLSVTGTDRQSNFCGTLIG